MLACLPAPKLGPTITLAMGEKGNITRLLAAKYGGYLTFAALSPERAQPLHACVSFLGLSSAV